MYILSQDGEKIVNTDRAFSICIENSDIMACVGDDYEIIGKYETVKNAKIVLNKIYEGLSTGRADLVMPRDKNA